MNAVRYSRTVKFIAFLICVIISFSGLVNLVPRNVNADDSLPRDNGSEITSYYNLSHAIVYKGNNKESSYEFYTPVEVSLLSYEDDVYIRLSDFMILTDMTGPVTMDGEDLMLSRNVKSLTQSYEVGTVWRRYDGQVINIVGSEVKQEDILENKDDLYINLDVAISSVEASMFTNGDNLFVFPCAYFESELIYIYDDIMNDDRYDLKGSVSSFGVYSGRILNILSKPSNLVDLVTGIEFQEQFDSTLYKILDINSKLDNELGDVIEKVDDAAEFAGNIDNWKLKDKIILGEVEIDDLPENNSLMEEICFNLGFEYPTWLKKSDFYEDIFTYAYTYNSIKNMTSARYDAVKYGLYLYPVADTNDSYSYKNEYLAKSAESLCDQYNGYSSHDLEDFLVDTYSDIVKYYGKKISWKNAFFDISFEKKIFDIETAIFKYIACDIYKLDDYSKAHTEIATCYSIMQKCMYNYEQFKRDGNFTGMKYSVEMYLMTYKYFCSLFSLDSKVSDNFVTYLIGMKPEDIAYYNRELSRTDGLLQKIDGMNDKKFPGFNEKKFDVVYIYDYEYNNWGVLIKKELREVHIVGYHGSDKDVVIPSSIQGAPVTEVRNCFKDCPNLESVVLPNTVENVKSCFFNCPNLTEVSLGSGDITHSFIYDDGVESKLSLINFNNVSGIHSSFGNCDSLTDIQTNTVDTVYDSFYDCSLLANVYLPNAVSIEGSFNWCEKLSAISANKLQELYDSFNGCGFESIYDVDIRWDRFEEIYSCFNECNNIKTIKFPANIKSVYSSFRSCEKLQSVDLNNVEELSGCSLFDCKEIDEIYVNNDLSVSICWECQIENNPYRAPTYHTFYCEKIRLTKNLDIDFEFDNYHPDSYWGETNGIISAAIIVPCDIYDSFIVEGRFYENHPIYKYHKNGLKGCTVCGEINDGVSIVDQFKSKDIINYVYENYDINNDYYLSKSEIDAVKTFDYKGDFLANVSGIEIFTNLENLSISLEKNYISKYFVDLSKLCNLKNINLDAGCYINEMIIADNSNIEEVNIRGYVGDLRVENCLNLLNLKSKCEMLTVNQCPTLEKIESTYGELKTLELVDLPNLKTLNCASNDLVKLSIIDCISLEEIDSSNNELMKVYLENTPVKKLKLHNNRNLKLIDFNGLKYIEYLDISGCNLNIIPIYVSISIDELICSNNNLSYILPHIKVNRDLDISNNEFVQLALNDIQCHHVCASYNPIEDVTGNENTEVYELCLSSTLIQNYEFPFLDELRSLTVNDTCIKDYDLSMYPDLRHFECNNVSSLDISNNLYLSYLNITSDKVLDIDISKHRFLLSGYVHSGKLQGHVYTNKSVHISNHATLMVDDTANDRNLRDYLRQFDLNNSKTLDAYEIYVLNSIDVSSSDVSNLYGLDEFVYLHDINCSDADLYGYVVLSNYKSLNKVDLSNNRFADLSINGLSELCYLDCSNTNLSTLNLDGCKELQMVYCFGDLYEENGISYYYYPFDKTYSDYDTYERRTYYRAIIVDSDVTINSPLQRSETAIKTNTPPPFVKKGVIGDGYSDAVIAAFPDANFRKYVMDNFDINKDGNLDASEIENVTDIELYYEDIHNLKGIELFTNLSSLEINSIGISELNLSSNKKLNFLSVYNIELGTLDLSSNTQLRDIAVTECGLSSINISNCSELIVLYLGDNSLNDLDISGNPSLRVLNCAGNNISSINATNNQYIANAYKNFEPYIEDGIAYYEERSEYFTLTIDVKTKVITDGSSVPSPTDPVTPSPTDPVTPSPTTPVIEGPVTADYFEDPNFAEYVMDKFDTNSDGVLDMKELESVKTISTYNRKINSVKGVEVFTNLISLDCFCEELTELDLSVCPNLECVGVYGNKITSINLSNSPKLEYLYLSYNNLTEIDISNCPSLKLLAVNNNKLTDINVSNNKNLYSLEVAGNNIKTLNISNNPDLIDAYENYFYWQTENGELYYGQLGESGYRLSINDTMTVVTDKPITPAPTDPVTPTPTVEPTPTPAPTPSQPVNDEGVIGFCTRLYTCALGRASDPQGVQNWADAIKSGADGAQAARGFFFSPEFTGKNLDNTEYVKRLYTTFMDREADPAGLQAWVKALDDGATREKVFDGFVNSVEWANVCHKYGIKSGGTAAPTLRIEPNDKILAFTERLYTTCLGRPADPSGLKAWADALANREGSGAKVASGFFFSPEFTNKNLDNTEYVKTLYRTFMDREADPAGLQAWVKALNDGSSREKVFDGFTMSPEFGALCEKAGIQPY